MARRRYSIPCVCVNCRAKCRSMALAKRFGWIIRHDRYAGRAPSVCSRCQPRPEN